MPNVRGKKFPYTKAGKAAAKKEMDKTKKRKKPGAPGKRRYGK